MKTTEISKDLIGKRCECIFTGMMVTGVIEDTEENEYNGRYRGHGGKRIFGKRESAFRPSAPVGR